MYEDEEEYKDKLFILYLSYEINSSFWLSHITYPILQKAASLYFYYKTKWKMFYFHRNKEKQQNLSKAMDTSFFKESDESEYIN